MRADADGWQRDLGAAQRNGIAVVLEIVTTKPLSLVPPSAPEPSRLALAERSDDDLMRLVGAGLKPAFIELARRHQGRLTTLCARSTGNLARGQEVAQDILLDLWRTAPSYRPAGAFLSFLYTMARNRLRSVARKRSAADAPVAQPTIEALHPEPEALSALLAREDARQLLVAMSNLSERHRLAVHLRYFEELSYQEIAAIADAPEGTVRSWVFHGLRELRRALEGGRS